MRGPIQSEQKPWDKVLLAVIMVLCIAMPVVAGLDAVRYGTSRYAGVARGARRAGIALGIYIFHVVMRDELICDGRCAHPETSAGTR